MAIMKGGGYVVGKPKKTRQGKGKHTKIAATSRNTAEKRYRGQGKGLCPFFIVNIYKKTEKTLCHV